MIQFIGALTLGILIGYVGRTIISGLIRKASDYFGGN